MKYYQKMCDWNSKSTKTNKYVRSYVRYTTLKNLMVYVRTNDSYDNFKINL